MHSPAHEHPNHDPEEVKLTSYIAVVIESSE